MKFGLKHSLKFPLQSSSSRHEVLVGGLWLLVPVYGWILNLGHRVIYTNKLLSGNDPFPAWSSKRSMFYHGMVTLTGMVVYHIPGSLVILAGQILNNSMLLLAGVALWLLGTMVIPGYMTRYCINFNKSVIFDLAGCLKEIHRMGKYYWMAWIYVFVGLLISFSGLLLFGLGFLFTSVYFWHVAAYSFASASMVSANQSLKGSA